MTKARRDQVKTRHRYGIGEWYGRSLTHLTAEERKRYAKIQKLKQSSTETPVCPFRGGLEEKIPCTKKGGVCSIRLYEQQGTTGPVFVPSGETGNLVTVCPYRFEQNGTILKWVGETLLGDPCPLVAEQVGFLERPDRNSNQKRSGSGPKFVGRIDKVLVHPTREPVHWCALEIQAVYFSGRTMAREFDMLRRVSSERLPFPATNHRPDFLTSGAIALMPRLQIWVRRLQRSAKKVAVVVDRSFFDALGKMGDARHVSNCDIAWFVVRFDDAQGQTTLTPDFVRFTTLEQAIEGLIAADTVTLEAFEARIRQRLTVRVSGPAAK
jgi:hypothetical protein